ncbi:MAG: FecR domain-containing protein [Betaproteobacteria bacterium]
MNPFDKIDDPRRRILIEALTLGLFAAIPAGNAMAQIFGSRPTKMPPEQSIYRIAGTVTVNGAPATLQTIIRPGDTVETGKGSEIVFVVGGHSMIVREDSRLEIEGDKKESSLLINGLRLLTGKLLSVSQRQSFRVTTATATIGIRGTGWYAESDPGQTYFCTCYGAADVSANSDPASRELVVSTHHDRPLYILADTQQGRNIRNAPFINHTDQELLLIETLVGRRPPFVFPKDDYGGPRRDY